MSPNVSSQVSLMSKRSRASRKGAFERLLSGMDSNMTHELVFFSELFAAPKMINSSISSKNLVLIVLPFAFELTNVVMKNFNMSLKLEKCSPGFSRTLITRITDLVQMSLLDVNRHLASTFKLVAANIL